MPQDPFDNVYFPTTATSFDRTISGGNSHLDADFGFADPATWWGVPARTEAAEPMVPAGQPVTITVTGLAELVECPRRWFLTRVLLAGQATSAASGIGRLVHRVHEAWVNAEIRRDMAAAQETVAAVWGSLPFHAEWHSRLRRQEVTDALVRLLAWLEANSDRIASAEREFDLRVALPDGDAVRLRGKADVGVRSGDDGLAVLDVKTAKSAPTRADVQRHVQLAGYQWAVQRGGLATPAGGEPAEPAGGEAAEPAGGEPAEPAGDGQGSASAGAGLLLASIPDGKGPGPKVLWQQPLDAPEAAAGPSWFEESLIAGVARIRAEQFPAIPSSACRTCRVSLLCPAKNPAQEVGR